MANNRFNKQVSPKGYAKGGKARKKPLGTFKDFPKEIIKTIKRPFTKKNKK